MTEASKSDIKKTAFSSTIMQLHSNIKEEIQMLNKPDLYNEQELSRINNLNKTINPNDWLEYVNPYES